MSMARLIYERNPFRVCFFVMWGIKGFCNMLGFYTVPGFPSVHEDWERITGTMLWLSSVALVVGLLWSGSDLMKREWDLLFVRRWGYLAYAISMSLFGIGSLTLDDGWLTCIVMLMFAACSLFDWRYENLFVKGMIRRAE